MSAVTRSRARGLAALLVAVLVAIVVVDCVLGPTAEYLNAYEIVRRSVPVPGLPAVSERFIFQQARWGERALLVAWVAYLVEAALVSGLLVLSRRVGASIAVRCRRGRLNPFSRPR